MDGSRQRNAGPVIAFCHVPKTAGSTVTNVMRGTFGLGHCRVIAKRGLAVTAQDLDLVCRLHPRVRAISGHHLLPFVDHGVHDERLRWFTVLREPTERFFSHYRHNVRAAGRPAISFADWCAETGARRGNLQVRWLAGGLDVERAKQILRQRFVAVGDQRDLNSSLRCFADRLGDQAFPTSTSRVDNVASVGLDGFDADIAARYNVLDIELYSWFRETIWPEQVSAPVVGPERPFVDGLAVTARRNVSRAYDGVVYGSAARLVTARREPRGDDVPIPRLSGQP